MMNGNIRPALNSKSSKALPSTENATWASYTGLPSKLPYGPSSPSKSKTESSGENREGKGKKVKRMNLQTYP